MVPFRIRAPRPAQLSSWQRLQSSAAWDQFFRQWVCPLLNAWRPVICLALAVLESNALVELRKLAVQTRFFSMVSAHAHLVIFQSHSPRSHQTLCQALVQIQLLAQLHSLNPQLDLTEHSRRNKRRNSQRDNRRNSLRDSLRNSLRNHQRNRQFCLLALLKSPCIRLPLALHRTSMQLLIATLNARYCLPLATRLRMAVLDVTQLRLADCTSSPLLHARLHL